jgi:hypothetical protein
MKHLVYDGHIVTTAGLSHSLESLFAIRRSVNVEPRRAL